MSSILLVGINAKFIHTNLAIRTLKANARECEDMVQLAEYTINHEREEIFQRIYEKKPSVIGFSCYLWNIDYVFSIANDIKKILPDVFIMVGGPEVAYRPEEILDRYDAIDLVMVGEGENTLYEFARQLRQVGNPKKIVFRDIAGVVYREGGQVHRTFPREAMPMDDLVFPYRDEDIMELEHHILYYESIRGCPFSCSYCLSSIEKTVRIKSPEKTEKELDFFLRNRVTQVKFVDRTFNCNRDYAYRIWKYIGEHDNGVTNFHFEIGGDLLREEDFALLATFRPGLVQFEIGVQSTNPLTIKAIRRTMDLEQLRENIARIHEKRNIHQHLDLIAGLPYEDYESFCQSFNDVYAMKPDQLQLGFLKVLDGSYMNEVKGEYDIRYSSQPPYEVFSTRWLSYEDILKLKQVEEMVEVYYNSFQFTATMAFLERFFATPYDMYRKLGEYYKENDLFEQKHSRGKRYEILWEFARETMTLDEQQREWMREVLTYDLYRRDYVKNPPSFVRLRDEKTKKEIREFFDRESEKPHIICGYEGFVTKQLFHMLYMNRFSLDMEGLIEEGVCRTQKPTYLLFDYQKRNPLDHSAMVIEISEMLVSSTDTSP